MNLTQKISKKLNYDVDQFSKKYEQHVKEFEDRLTKKSKIIDDALNTLFIAKHKIMSLKANERALIDKKNKLQKSITTENSTDIQKEIANITSEISTNNRQQEKLKSIKLKLSVKRNKLKDDLPRQTNELYKLKNKLKNKALKKKAAIFLENKLIKSQKEKDEKRFKDLHIPDHEDLSKDEFNKYNSEDPKNYINLTTLSVMPNLLDVFESISTNIDNGFKSNIFKNNLTNQTYTIITNLLEIRLNLELQLDNHDTLIKIRIRKPQSKNSVIRMLHSKKQKDTMIIERVNTIDNEIPVSCSLYLAFLLCTILKIRVIELFDNNDRKSKYDQYMSTGKPVGITKDIMYSHDLSYYNDY